MNGEEYKPKWHAWLHLVVIDYLSERLEDGISAHGYYQITHHVTYPDLEKIMPSGYMDVLRGLSLKRISNDLGKLYRMGFLSRKRVVREIYTEKGFVKRGYMYRYFITKKGRNYMAYKLQHFDEEGCVVKPATKMNWSPEQISKRKYEQLEKEIDEWRKKYERAIEMGRALKESTDDLLSENKRLRAKIEELEEENRRMSEEINELNSEVESLREKNRELKKKMNKVNIVVDMIDAKGKDFLYDAEMYRKELERQIGKRWSKNLAYGIRVIIKEVIK